MNVTANANTAPSAAPEKLPAGELVVQNGRLKGTRRPLNCPMTLIGQDVGCEIRLNIKGVKPQHCAIVQGPEGFVLRDLSGTAGTFVNGQRVSLYTLRHGDQLTIGAFQFAIVIPEGLRPETLHRQAEVLKAERDALRIQVAAVVSQQAGLTEEEIRLEQRRIALQRQEEQLAARLDERQAELKDQDEQLRQERTRFEAAREAEETRLGQASEALAKALADQEQASQQLAGQRRKLVALRNRVKRRFQQSWQGLQARQKQWEQKVVEEEVRIQREAEALERERSRFAEARLRLNGEIELGRRQVREEWQQLGLAQQEWEATLNLEQAERARRARELEEQVKSLTARDRKLAEEKKFWTRHQAVLEMDVDGLEKRIHNQRQKLLVLEQELVRHGQPGALAVGAVPVNSSRPVERTGGGGPEALPFQPTDETSAGSPAEVPEILDRLVGELSDQRLHLLEQWQRLLQAEESWQKEREEALAEVEAVTQSLRQHEDRLDLRAEQVVKQERALEDRGNQLRQRQEALSLQRCALEGWQARLTLQASGWEVQREEVLSAVRAREEAVAAQAYQFEDLHRRRTQRLKKQAADLVKAHKRAEAMRLQYAELWKACQQVQQTLVQEQQAVARQTLTLERFRLECLAQAPNSAAAEKRLERLQRNCLLVGEEASRQIEHERQALLAESIQLDQRAQELADLEQHLLRRHEEVATQLTDLENQQVAVTEAQTRRHQEVQRLENQHRAAEQQVRELRDEVERLARMLIEEADTDVKPPTSQAA